MKVSNNVENNTNVIHSCQNSEYRDHKFKETCNCIKNRSGITIVAHKNRRDCDNASKTNVRRRPYRNTQAVNFSQFSPAWKNFFSCLANDPIDNPQIPLFSRQKRRKIAKSKRQPQKQPQAKTLETLHTIRVIHASLKVQLAVLTSSHLFLPDQ